MAKLTELAAATALDTGDLLYVVDDGSSRRVHVAALGAIFGGDVSGPGASTDNAIVRWDGITGEAVQNSGVVIDDSDRLLFGTASTISSGTQNGARAQIHGTSTGTTELALSEWSNNTGPVGSVSFAKSRGAAIGTHAIVNNGDSVGLISAAGSNGTTFDILARIDFEVDGTPGATTDMPGLVRISTTPEASATPVERLRIDAGGNVRLGPASGGAYTPTEAILIVNNTDDNPWTAKFGMFHNDTFGPALLLYHSRGTTVGAASALVNNDTLGEIWFGGSDGTSNFELGAAIQAEVDGTIGTDNIPTRLVFYTRADGDTDFPDAVVRIDSAGRLIVGGIASVAQGAIGAGRIQNHGTSTATSTIGTTAYATSDSVAPTFAMAKSGNATAGSHTIVADGETCGLIAFLGSNGTSFDIGARIDVRVDGTPGASNDMPMLMAFSIAADGSATPTERMMIKNTTTARDTFLMLYDVDNGTLERVTVGIADSGGAGFKVLRIPN